VRHFRAFPVYYLGRSFDGYSLNDDASGDVRNFQPGTSVSFTYGNCTEPAGPEPGGCHPPVEVQNYSVCNEYPLRYGPNAIRHLTRVDGYPALNFGSETLEIYSRHTAIKITAPTPAQVHAAVRQLYLVNPHTGWAKHPRPLTGGYRNGYPRGCDRRH